MTRLATLTTLRVGGPARRIVRAADDDAAIAAVRSADEAGEPVLVLAGGSNVVVADDGFPGTVVRVASRGLEHRDDDGLSLITVAAGEPWDEVVAACVEAGLAGIECLSGIPGSTGATPIQNVGAYGQDVGQTIVSVRAYDRRGGDVHELAPAELGLSYRSSALKRHPGRWLVLSVTFGLVDAGRSMPIVYPELARELAISPGETAPLASVRAAVLRVRARKGMVVDPADPDSVSAGSFFMNPILTAEDFARLDRRVRERLGGEVSPPRFTESDGRVKTSAAWLVERAGFARGYGDGAVGISSKHTLALVNRGGGTASELLALACEIADRVAAAFEVELRPEPVLVGLDWDGARAAVGARA